MQSEPATKQFTPLSRLEWLAVWGVALVVLLVRLAFAAQRGFWLDEYYTYQAAIAPLADMIPERLSAGHSPLYFLYAKLFVLLFGTSEVALKSSSALASAAVVVASAGLAARIGLRRALPALLAFALMHPYWQRTGTEFRYMMPLIALGGFWSWAAVAHFQQPCRRHGIVLMVIGTVALWTHGSAQFIGLSLLLFFVLMLRQLPREQRTRPIIMELFAPFVAALALSMPLLVGLSTLPRVAQALSNQVPSLRRAFTNQLETLFADDKVFISLTGLSDDLFSVMAIVIYLAGIAAAVRYCRREHASALASYLVATLAGFPLIVMTMTLVSRAVDGPARYVAFTSLPLLLLVVTMWEESRQWRAWGWITRGVLALTMAMAFSMQALNQGDWHRESIRWLAQHRQADQPVITVGRNMNLIALRYHGVRQEGIIAGLNSEIPEQAVAFNMFHRAFEEADSGFFLVYHPGDVRPLEIVRALSQEGFFIGTRTWHPTESVMIIGLARTSRGVERLKRLPDIDPPAFTDQPIER